MSWFDAGRCDHKQALRSSRDACWREHVVPRGLTCYAGWRERVVHVRGRKEVGASGRAMQWRCACSDAGWRMRHARRVCCEAGWRERVVQPRACEEIVAAQAMQSRCLCGGSGWRALHARHGCGGGRDANVARVRCDEPTGDAGR